MRDLGLDVFLVPRADEHQGEYVAKRSERLAWLTGFTGSAGYAAIGRRSAALFVDGRYTVQAKAQVDTDVFQIRQIPNEKLSDWLITAEAKGAVVGFDPWLHTVTEIERLTEALAPKGLVLKAVPRNPVDRIWGKARPAAPAGSILPHPERYAGQSAAEKIAAVQKRLAADGQDAVVLTLPDSIAWLLNIRGTDVPHTPFPHAYAILGCDAHVDLFIDRRKFTPGLDEWLGNKVTVRPQAELGPHLKTLKGRKVQVDPATAAAWLFDRLKEAGATVQRANDPVLLPKACKNATELAGTRRAHERDGIALSKFLAWLAAEAPKGGVDEIEACRVLENFRLETGILKDLSFGSISGAGPNAALPHYRVTSKSNRKLRSGEIYLVDSGGQYLDGTTDVTRTIVVGTPTAEMKDRFTRVLKGHIALARARFPEGTTGVQLDTLARMSLWEGGYDYDHGTGHGVGAYLSVHEGPQNISKKQVNVPLRPGMIISNEPGYYKVGHYGIRIENLIVVTEPKDVGGERRMMEFETITLAPIDLNLVEPGMLSDAERKWLNDYHARVREKIAPGLEGSAKAWLLDATRPV